MADLSMRISREELPSLRVELERLRARIEGDHSLATYVAVEDRYLQAKRELVEVQRVATVLQQRFDTAHDLMLKAQRERDELKADSEQGIHPAERQLAEARALLTAVADSGVEWSTPGYVLVQIDRATWSAITAAPTPTPAPAVSGFDFPPEGA